MRKVIKDAAVWVALAGTMAASGAMAQAPTPAAQQQMLGLLERGALYRDKVDWAKLRADLAATSDPGRQEDLLADAIRRSSAGHGKWISVERQAATRTPQGSTTDATKSASAALPAAAAQMQNPRLGRVNVGPYATDRSLPRADRFARDRQWAQGLQAEIRSQDDGSRCGWIVDLRGNTGGNMWPMLLGVGPLLHGGGDPGQQVGTFDTGDGLQAWGYRNDAVWNDDQVRISLGASAYVLKHPDAPVAVLQSGRTASSGEAIVLAFRGRPDTRSFGHPTAGYSTGNSPVQLVDGSLLLLTGSVMKDRNGVGDGSRIPPDVAAADDAETLRLAEHWLLQQPACREKPAVAVAVQPHGNGSH